jgi:1,2-diacylglycerol 3-alpha-glucosyltransferase
MNVGIFTDTYPPQINGVATSTLLLARELRKRGHKVYVFTTSDPGADIKEDGVFRMPSFPVPFSPSNRAAFFFSPLAMAQVGRLKPDIIHTQTEFSLGILGKVVSEFTRAPLIHTYHTMYEEYVHYIAGGRIITKKAAQRYSRVFCNRAAAVIAPAEKAKNSLLSYGVIRPVRVIPTGIDFGLFKRGSGAGESAARLKEKLGVPPEAPVVISIGRVAKEKSLDKIVRQWGKINAAAPGSRFVIVGDGPCLEELKNCAAELGVSDTVIFAGRRPWKDIGPYYRIGDLFVCASTSETQGLTYIEAMAAKTPVCAQKDDSVAGVLENGLTGWTFESEDTLAETVIKALKDPEGRKRAAEAAYRRIAPLSSENFAAAVETLYEDTIKSRLAKNKNLYL